MRHFFITTLERLMNVLVVLTALGILALAGQMAIEAQGDTQALLRAAVVFLGGFVALLTVAGVAYLAIDIRQNSRRMVRLLETGGRAARPLVATRGTDDVVRHGRRSALEAENDAEDADEAPAVAAQPRRVSRFAANVRAEAKSREQDARKAEPRTDARAEPRMEQRHPELYQPDLRQAEARQAPISQATTPQATTPQTERRQPDVRPAAPRLEHRPAEPAEDYAFHAEEVEQPRSSTVFSGRGMPKMRQSEPQAEPEVAFEADSQAAIGGYDAEDYAPSARPGMAKAARLVADRRPLR